MDNVIGDYELIRKIGEGSCSEVFLAQHRFVKKQFAIKLLHEDLTSDPGFLKNFEEVSSLLISMQHPSIVKVHAFSSSENRFFLVMDCIEDASGQMMNLSDYLLTRGPVIPEAEVEVILRQIASALDYAHSLQSNGSQLLHRSLKLSNILINPDAKGLRVYLTDFALSSLFGEKKIFSTQYARWMKNLPQEDVFLFLMQDYAFLAPEQKNKNASEMIDAAADVYSFGVLAYYLIAREFPEGYFDLPSMIAPEYKLNWDLFICRCLQKNPEKRPEKITEALNTLLSKNVSDLSSLDVLSWEEVEKKVENAMQMSFEFSSDDLSQSEDKSKIESDVPVIKEEKPSLTNKEEHYKNEPPKPVIRPSIIERPSYDPDPGAIFQKELNVSHYQPKKVEVQEVEPLFSEMIVIPEGTYYRGSNEGARDEMPRHKVFLSSFAIDIHPVTNEQFVRFLQSMGGEKDHNNNDIIRMRDSRIKKKDGKYHIESGYMKHPVVGVTWYGADAYAKWIGKRLPTEAEWEVASKGGLENAIFPTDQKIDHTLANYFSADTTAVKSYPANPYGLYDMVGNVYEWCLDWYAYNYYDISQQDPDNPLGPQQGVYRVMRGGCWKSLEEDLRCSHRHRNNPGSVNGTYGFRCAAEVV